ncbi:hypothetical protein ACKKBG_A13560 [Auxenochlorella protothecoides x Auxenochlorella symbiontica]
MASTASGPYAKLIVNIKSAHNLTDPTWLGKADPYAILKVAGAEIQTHHIKNAGENATWDETFAFNNVAIEDILELSVYDYNKVRKDGIMGTGSLALREAFEEGRIDTRIPLSNKTGSKDAGEVWINIRTEGLSTAAVAQAAGLETDFKPLDMDTSREAHSAADRQGVDDASGGQSGAAWQSSQTGQVAGVEGVTKKTEGLGLGDGGNVRKGEEVVLGQDKYTTTEDRSVVKERVDHFREHRPVEKEFVVETRATGQERDLVDQREVESLGVKERILNEEPILSGKETSRSTTTRTEQSK